MTRVRSILWTVSGVILLGLTAPVHAQPDPGALDELIEWLDPLELEETDETLAVYARIRTDPLGGFIVTDTRAAQVRLHGPDGALRAHFGRSGEGPGEFRRLRAAYRVDPDTVHAVDADGRLTSWTSEGVLIGDSQLQVRGVLNAGAADDSTLVVVTGPSFTGATEWDARTVRIFDRHTLRERDAGLSLPIRADNLMAAASLTGAGPIDPGARTAITWPIFDTIWVADAGRLSLSRVEAIPIGSEAMAANTPPVDRRQDPEGYSEWAANSSLASDAFELPDGGWLVTIVQLGGPDDSVGLVRVRADGSAVWEVQGAPAPALIDADGVLYFRDPSGLRPNVFLRGRLR